MEKKWIQDLMSQSFTEGTFLNPTRLIIATCLVRNSANGKISKDVLAEYVYRTYADNPEIASRNPSIVVRNICNYGICDIYSSVEEALFDWSSDAKNGVLSYDNLNVYVPFEITDSIIATSTQVIKMMYKKYFKSTIFEPIEIQDDDVNSDLDLYRFGSGVFKRRVLEDMQYCPLCEETKKLFCVHILPNEFNQDLLFRKDKNNGLVMCEEHASSYNNKEFYFNEKGFVEYSTSETVTKNMHLSFSILNKKRRKAIKMYRDRIEKSLDD